MGGPPAAGNLRSRRHSTLAALRAVTRKTGISGAMLATPRCWHSCRRQCAIARLLRPKGIDGGSADGRQHRPRPDGLLRAGHGAIRRGRRSPAHCAASSPLSEHRHQIALTVVIGDDDGERDHPTGSPPRNLQRAQPLWCKPHGCEGRPGPIQQPRHSVGRPPRYIHRSKSWVDVMRHQTFTSPRRDSFGWLAAGCRLGAARANGEVVDDVDHAGDHPSKPTHGGDILRPQHLPL